ncbi:MAG: hypothetical protein HYS81_05250 [Candidatus Aenigmatarchaeota archaeon]|nr:MAG: hypothetical protein HYS81_05250 [Candidatus Aenigmarchaeota archaeon]
MVLWWLSVVGFFIGLYGLVLLRRAIGATTGRLRTGLVFFLYTDASYMLYNLIAAYLGFAGIQTSDPLWAVFIAVHAIPGATWAYSMYTISRLGGKG